LNSQSPGSSRPGSSLSGGFAGTKTGTSSVSKDGDHWESFKGKGETLNGRKTKGKGMSHRKAEQVSEGSKIIRTDKRKIVSNDTLESDVKVPVALNLPFGQLFFGFNVPAYTPPSPPSSPGSPEQGDLFAGTGNTLSGRPNPSVLKGKEKDDRPTKSSSDHAWGSGQTLGRRTGAPKSQQRTIQRSPSPEEEEDWGVDDDDDVIMVDSD